MLAWAAPAAAEPAVGVIAAPGSTLVTFDTAAPGAFTSVVPVSGLAPGERLAALDFRFAPGAAQGLYGLGVTPGATDTVRLYRIDPGNGAATPVGGPIGGLATSPSASYDVDFEPSGASLRVVNSADENLRIDPVTGARADVPPASDLLPAGRAVAGIAYGATTPATLYGLSHALQSLVTIGGPGGVPPADAGAVAAVGAFAVTSADAGAQSLDVSPTGTAYATLVAAGEDPALYRQSLASGALTLAGRLPAPLRALAVMPADTVHFSAATYASGESGAVTITVTRSGAASDTAHVAYATADGSATTADYEPASGTLTFAPGERSRSFTVAIRPDELEEGPETVQLSLSAPSPLLALGRPATATLTIADDDAGATAPDTRPPGIALGRLPRVVSLARLRRGIRVSARPNEPAQLQFALLATARAAQLSAQPDARRRGTRPRARRSAAFNIALATRTLRIAPGRRSVRLKPRRALLGAPRGPFRVRVQVIAADAARNVRTVSRTLTVEPPRRARR